MESPLAEQIQVDIANLLSKLTNDSEREGLLETPKRYSKFMVEFLSKPDFNFTTFDADGHSQMIIQKGIQFWSLCEHHLLPFFGKGIIAYIPNKRIVGLSKLARTLEYYSRGLQNQERLTDNVADRLETELSPQGVGIILCARHTCMEMRGIKAAGSETTTSALRGVFLENAQVRNEFIALSK